MVKGKNILVVDDDKTHRMMLKMLLTEWGYCVKEADDGSTGFDMIKNLCFDIVLLDMKMLKMSGMEALEKINEYNPALPVIIMTAYSSVETAVEALKKGAYDYLTKPLDFDKLKLTIQRILETIYIKKENKSLKKALGKGFSRDNIIGNSHSMIKLFETIEMAAPTDANILITGESGTGKELIAGALHYNSNRKDNPFVKINCAAITASLLESELFGHERGAFTGADKKRKGRFLQADRGSILLDEIGEMDLSLQVKLLRVIQEREVTPVGSDASIKVDVRVISSTNRDLKALVRENKFREDLFFRINVVELKIPPLRERKEDIPELALHFLNFFAKRNHRDIKGFTPDAMDAMIKYNWPGNVRELMNSVERGVVLAKADYLRLEDFPFFHYNDNSALDNFIQKDSGQADSIANDDSDATDHKDKADALPLSEIEKKAILKTLQACKGNKSETARRLKITRKTLLKKLKQYGKA